MRAATQARRSDCAKAPSESEQHQHSGHQTAVVVLRSNLPLRRFERSSGSVDGFDSDIPQEEEAAPHVHRPPPAHRPGRVRDLPQPVDARPLASEHETDTPRRAVAKPDVALLVAAEQLCGGRGSACAGACGARAAARGNSRRFRAGRPPPGPSGCGSRARGRPPRLHCGRTRRAAMPGAPPPADRRSACPRARASSGVRDTRARFAAGGRRRRRARARKRRAAAPARRARACSRPGSRPKCVASIGGPSRRSIRAAQLAAHALLLPSLRPLPRDHQRAEEERAGCSRPRPC